MGHTAEISSVINTYDVPRPISKRLDFAEGEWKVFPLENSA